MQLQTSRFQRLGQAFYASVPPSPLPQPYWVGRSRVLADQLGLEPTWLEQEAALALHAGNLLPTGVRPLAGVYSGHQFGVWAGQLGDGRALLLGELDSPIGLQEIQLKGSGLTPFSRMGDGRAVLRSSIREFLCSEAMHGLGIPTTRALCVTGSDAPVYRETRETAAVLTRVAPSFIRFGHFEHFSANGRIHELQRLADFVIDHFYPACRQRQGNPYAALLAEVALRTADLLAQWQAVGFCHGVMNTDNLSVLGLTLDYGPFQFLDAFDPGHICNHSDHQGRYAFARQPAVAYWNLFCLGQALLPLIGEPEAAVAMIEPYQARFKAQFVNGMRAKLGLVTAQADDAALIDDVLALLAQQRVDYALFWHRLGAWVAQSETRPDPGVLPLEQAASAPTLHDLFVDGAVLDHWLLSYSERLAQQGQRLAVDLMKKTNPHYVLRNHLAENAIEAARQRDYSGVQTLLGLLQTPFDEHPGFASYAGLPPAWAAQIEISCSS